MSQSRLDAFGIVKTRYCEASSEVGDKETERITSESGASGSERPPAAAAELAPDPSPTRELRADGLHCSYRILYERSRADAILSLCEQNIEYLNDSRVRVFGEWHKIPRKQAAYGDDGIEYTFAGCTVTAKPWPAFLRELRDHVSTVADCQFNFVLINRYKDGADYMGEHRDNEAELEPKCPIASLSFGQRRDFVFRRYVSSRSVGRKRLRSSAETSADSFSLSLEHGSLLIMHHPTNQLWTHALPPRKAAPGVRVNLTFRRMRIGPLPVCCRKT